MNPDHERSGQNINKIWSDPGSFKDPDGGILYSEDRVYRYFKPEAWEKFQALNESGLLAQLTRKRLVIESIPVTDATAAELQAGAPEGSVFIEHPRIPFVSYCYEWSFEMLRAAALTYLEVQRFSLEYGYVLKDATPYNVQFIGNNPILIDVASFEPYQEGEPWVGYSEFCRLFLNPLYLQALTSVSFQHWLRGSLQGIFPGELSRLLPARRKLRPNVFINVVLQAWLEQRFSQPADIAKIVKRPKISKNNTARLISRLSGTIRGLKSKNRPSKWIRYDQENSYSDEARSAKMNFVENVLAESNPNVIWDLGCNVGEFSLLAAKHAGLVVAMDQDPDVIDILFHRANSQNANVLPLVIDVLDPSPERGWAQSERRGFLERGPADMVLALALTHHLAVAGNIPLSGIMNWLTKAGRAAIIEFVPKEDPTFQSMLRWREDIYRDYTKQAFEEAIERHFEIVDQCTIPDSNRILYSVITLDGETD